MGIFDFFTGGEEGQIKRHAKRLRNLNSQGEDRMLSAQWLAEQGSEEAIVGLLGRFMITYEQRMKDTQEKEQVHQLLLGLATRALPAIKQWVLRNEAFAIPLSVVEEIEGPAAAVDLLLEMLGREVDPFKTEKKRQILVKLADYIDPRISDRVPACLEDFDEGVRYAAAETLLAQEEASIQWELAKALARRDEDSNRLRVRIADGFLKRGWGLGEYAETVAERPPVGWRFAGGKLVPG